MLHCLQMFTYTCDAGKLRLYVGKTCITQTTNILRIHLPVLSLHIIWHTMFFNLKKNLLHSFDPYTCITFYLHCICAMFLGAHAHRNAMERSIEICLL